MKRAAQSSSATKWITTFILSAFLLWATGGSLLAQTEGAQPKNDPDKPAKATTQKMEKPKVPAKAPAKATKTKGKVKAKAKMKPKAKVKPQAKTKKKGPQPWVVKLQKKLSAKGFVVKADGIMGPQTHNAIKQFQAKNGLQPTGQVNELTLKKLYK